MYGWKEATIVMECTQDESHHNPRDGAWGTRRTYTNLETVYWWKVGMYEFVCSEHQGHFQACVVFLQNNFADAHVWFK